MISASNNFYRVYADHEQYPDQWFLDDPRTADGHEIDARDFRVGRSYTGPLPVIVPVGNKGRELAFNLGAFDMPVVSQAVAKVIRRIAARDVQLFPVTIPGAKDRYEILNVISRAECLDELRSEFTMWSEADKDPERLGKYSMISTIRIDPARVDGHHLFRIARWTLALLVSEPIKDALQEIPQLGVVFQSVV
jgi:hypothetical protein